MSEAYQATKSLCQSLWLPRVAFASSLRTVHPPHSNIFGVPTLRNAPTYDQPLEWRPLKGRPFDTDEELQTLSILGNVTEFENRGGHRYRRVTEDGINRWFSLRSGQGTSIEVQRQVKVCCKKFQAAFGKFIDRSWPSGPICIFPRNNGVVRTRRHKQISHCPFCGKKIRFVKLSEVEWRPLARTAKAGARH